MTMQNALENLSELAPLYKVIRFYKAYEKEKSAILLIEDTQQRIDAENKLEATKKTEFLNYSIGYILVKAVCNFDAIINLLF